MRLPLPFHQASLPRAGARAAATAALLAGLAAPAHAGIDFSIGLNFPLGHAGYFQHGHHGHHGHHGYRGPVYGSLPRGAISVQIGGGHYWRHGDVYYRPWGPQWVVVAPPVLLGEPVLLEPPRADPPLPATPSRPDPVIYPRNGQGAQQTEADRQDCNRWATTQPAALAEAAVFHRAVAACMDGRGYTLK